MKLTREGLRLFCASALLCAAAPGYAHSDLASTVAECDSCHGKDGVSEFADMPTIAGISAFAHADALYVYRDSARPCKSSKYRYGDTERAETTMCAQMKEMTDDQIEAVAAHYAGKPFVAAKQAFDADLAERGKAVHAELCDQCHTDGGSVADDDASILAGQHAAYLRQSFADYRSGERDQTKKMKVKMDKVSDEDIEALVHYYASQQ